MTRYTLMRSGTTPLRFSGEVLSTSAGRFRGGQDANRWHDLKLYRTDGGQYVLSIVYHTIWQGEENRFTVVEAESPDALAVAIGRYDPTSPVAGFPPGDAYAEKQTRMLGGLRRSYEAQVVELFDGVEDEFAEERP